MTALPDALFSNKPPGAPSALVKEVEIEANRRPRQIKPGVLCFR